MLSYNSSTTLFDLQLNGKFIPISKETAISIINASNPKRSEVDLEYILSFMNIYKTVLSTIIFEKFQPKNNISYKFNLNTFLFKSQEIKVKLEGEVLEKIIDKILLSYTKECMLEMVRENMINDEILDFFKNFSFETMQGIVLKLKISIYEPEITKE